MHQNIHNSNLMGMTTMTMIFYAGYCGLQDNLRSTKKWLWDTFQNQLPVTNSLQDIMI